MSSQSSRTDTYLDDDDYGYAEYGNSTIGDRKRRPPNRPSTPNHNQTNDEDEAKEYRKKLFISLAMLLPAIAAIIGVMAWAISAEVVLGAKREASRRIGENGGGGGGNYLKLPNRYDYTRFTSAPLLPLKEMLVDHRNYNRGSKTKKKNNNNNNNHNNNDDDDDVAGTASNPVDILQKHLEDLSKEYHLHKRIDPDEGSANMNELKNRLLHENLSQLLAKLFNNQNNNNNNNQKSNIDNGTKPTIVVVAPLASQSSKTFSETKVTTSKPKALELKIASVSGHSSKDGAGNNNSRDGGHHHKNHHQQQPQPHHHHDKNSLKMNDQSKSMANKNSIKRKITNQNVVNAGGKKSTTTNNGSNVKQQPTVATKTSMDSKRKTSSNQIVVQKPRNSMQAKHLSTKQQNFNNKNSKSINVGGKQHMATAQGSTGKGSKGKTYEKEIDLLLQKIEKLEKQKLQPQTSNIKLKSPKIMVKDFDKKRPSGVISEKIRKFMESAPKEERNEPNQAASQDSGNHWDPMQPMMHPLPPPIPMPPPPMPMMPFMPPYMPPMPQQADPIVDQQQQQQQPHEMNPMAPMQEYPDPDPQYYQQQQQQQQMPQPTEYMSDEYLAQQQQSAPMVGSQPIQMMNHPYQSSLATTQYQQSQQQQPTLIEGFQPIYSAQPQNQPQQAPAPASQPMSTIQQSPSTNLMNGQYSQQYQPQSNHIYNTLTNDQMNQISKQQQQSSKSSKAKPNKSVSLFGRRFQIGKIFTLPKGRKTKKQQQQQQQQLQQEQEMAMQQQSENFEQLLLNNPPTVPPPTDNAPFDPMMAQESQQPYSSSSVDRGYRPSGGGGYPMETAGMSVRFGGGPLGGGSQVKVNPMAILKTIALPMMRRPALNLNGKVVFGVVLENGAGGYGRKPKTVFQHYSTGRIKRRRR